MNNVKMASIQNNALIIKFSGPDFTISLSIVKSLDGREFVKDKQYWIAPYTESNYKILKDAGFELPAIEPEKQLPEIDKALFPLYRDFQLDGIRFLESVHGIGMVNFDCGLGKSALSIGYAKLHPEIRPILVVCPASIKLNWTREITKWIGEDSYILNGEKPDPIIPRNYKWYIINYDILAYGEYDNAHKLTGIKGWIDRLSELNIQGIIVDEFQMLASPKTIRTLAVSKAKKLLKPKMFVPLSGTPMRNRPADLFNILHLISPEMFPNRWKFLWKFGSPVNNGFGWTFTGASNIEELHTKIKPFMIRRLKADVLTELPPKQKIIVPMELNELELKEYKKADDEFLSWVKEYIQHKKQDSFQGQIERLKQLSYMAKRNAVIQWIKDYLTSENKLVVFTYHKKALGDIYSQFKKVAVKLDGSSSLNERQGAVDAFQNDSKVKLFIGQIQAAGVGITLTAANACAFVEFGYTPSDHEQGESRIHRMTSKADSITAYYLVAEGTVEDDMMLMINNKYDNISRIIDGKAKGDFFTSTDNFSSGILKKYVAKLHNTK